MGKTAANYPRKFDKLLAEIRREHPELRTGQIFSLAFSSYNDTFHVSEKEMFYALEKYKTELDLDVQHVAPDEYVQQIQEDANHLFDVIDEDEEEEY